MMCNVTFTLLNCPGSCNSICSTIPPCSFYCIYTWNSSINTTMDQYRVTTLHCNEVVPFKSYKGILYENISLSLKAQHVALPQSIWSYRLCNYQLPLDSLSTPHNLLIPTPSYKNYTNTNEAYTVYLYVPCIVEYDSSRFVISQVDMNSIVCVLSQYHSYGNLLDLEIRKLSFLLVVLSADLQFTCARFNLQFIA